MLLAGARLFASNKRIHTAQLLFVVNVTHDLVKQKHETSGGRLLTGKKITSRSAH